MAQLLVGQMLAVGSGDSGFAAGGKEPGQAESSQVKNDMFGFGMLIAPI